MTRLTESEYQEILAKKHTQDSDNDEANGGPEANLANKIREWADRKGYPCLIHPQTKKLSWFVPEGYVDVVLTLPYGVTLYIELKSKSGRVRDKQKLMAMQLTQLGHEYRKIKSFKRFLEITEEIK